MALSLGQGVSDRTIEGIVSLIKQEFSRKYGPSWRVGWMRIVATNQIIFQAEEMIAAANGNSERSGKQVQLAVDRSSVESCRPNSVEGKDLADTLVEELVDKINRLNAADRDELHDPVVQEMEEIDEVERERQEQAERETVARKLEARRKAEEEAALAAELAAAAADIEQLVNLETREWGQF